MEYLPDMVRDHFASSVAEFISIAHTQSEDIEALMRGDMSQKLFQSLFFPHSR